MPAKLVEVPMRAILFFFLAIALNLPAPCWANPPQEEVQNEAQEATEETPKKEDRDEDSVKSCSINPGGHLRYKLSVYHTKSATTGVIGTWERVAAAWDTHGCPGEPSQY